MKNIFIHHLPHLSLKFIEIKGGKARVNYAISELIINKTTSILSP